MMTCFNINYPLKKCIKKQHSAEYIVVSQKLIDTLLKLSPCSLGNGAIFSGDPYSDRIYVDTEKGMKIAYLNNIIIIDQNLNLSINDMESFLKNYNLL